LKAVSPLACYFASPYEETREIFLIRTFLYTFRFTRHELTKEMCILTITQMNHAANIEKSGNSMLQTFVGETLGKRPQYSGPGSEGTANVGLRQKCLQVHAGYVWIRRESNGELL
jgi:hypothetical protein